MVEPNRVMQHYEQASLVERLQLALTAAGLGEERLSPDDLAPLDQFHSRGLAATVELARELDIGNAMRVLDIGSGLGGPSRYLAATYGCRVDGIDLSQSFVESAIFLSERSALAGKGKYQRGAALVLPFEANTFDYEMQTAGAWYIASLATY